MKVYTTPIFLFFIKKYNGINGEFSDALFHFYRHLAIETEIKENRLFWIDHINNKLVDKEERNVLRTLLHHKLLDNKYRVSENGEKFLAEFLESDKRMAGIFEDFQKKYKGESYKDKSCYIEKATYPISCQLCTNRVCQNNKIKKSDFLNLINFKGLPSPYKKIIYSNPFFQ